MEVLTLNVNLYSKLLPVFILDIVGISDPDRRTYVTNIILLLKGK